MHLELGGLLIGEKETLFKITKRGKPLKCHNFLWIWPCKAIWVWRVVGEEGAGEKEVAEVGEVAKIKIIKVIIIYFGWFYQIFRFG